MNPQDSFCHNVHSRYVALGVLDQRVDLHEHLEHALAHAVGSHYTVDELTCVGLVLGGKIIGGKVFRFRLFKFKRPL